MPLMSDRYFNYFTAGLSYLPSFIGMWAQPPTTLNGIDVKEARSDMFLAAQTRGFIPSVSYIFIVLAFKYWVDGYRDTDPKLKHHNYD